MLESQMNLTKAARQLTDGPRRRTGTQHSGTGRSTLAVGQGVGAIGCLLTIINVQAEADCGQVRRRAKSACVIAFRSLSRINLAEKFIQLQSEATEACSKWENK